MQATRRGILEATRLLGVDDLNLDPTLDQVAGRAGVSVQTVLRHFGSRSTLLDAVHRYGLEETRMERRAATSDPESAIDSLLAHYEAQGDFALALLARESTDPRAAEITTAGRALHRQWVTDAFAQRLPADPGRRDALVDLLVVATDVFAWKLLRHDRSHPLPVVRERVLAMVEALLATAS